MSGMSGSGGRCTVSLRPLRCAQGDNLPPFLRFPPFPPLPLPLRVELGLRLEVLPQYHTQIHPPKRVRQYHDLPGPEGGCHVAGSLWVPATDYDLSRVRHRVGVSQKHNIEPAPPEHAGGRARSTLAAGTIQHFHHDPARRRCDLRRGGCLGTLVPEEKPASGPEQNDRRDQREPAPVATRLFQKRNVGSRMGHPDLTI